MLTLITIQQCVERVYDADRRSSRIRGNPQSFKPEENLLCTEPKWSSRLQTARVIAKRILRESDHVGTDQQNRAIH